MDKFKLNHINFKDKKEEKPKVCICYNNLVMECHILCIE